MVDTAKQIIQALLMTREEIDLAEELILALLR